MLPELFYIINFSISISAAIIALTTAFLILITVICIRSCRTIPNLLICNTSVATILYYLLNLVSIFYALQNDWEQHQPGCVFRAYSYTALCAALCYSYSIHAISRLLFTVFYTHKSLQTWFIHWMMIIISWSISILTPTIPLFFQHGYQLENESRICLPTVKIFSTAICSVLIAFIIPLNIVASVYSSIFFYAWKSTYRIRSLNSHATNLMISSHTRLLKVKREIKLMQKILVLICLVLFGGTPYFILVLWHVLLEESPPEPFYLLSTNCIAIFISLKMITLFCMCKQIKTNVLHYLLKLQRY
ncbi:unnamed protein product [Adineta ricciae]|uniref:G-protein coupled receptors family 1 profile domain-containing protein n=1 Tax=Adineta ricciae TaxID=249248 RepID=A0A813QAV0_ADIRI|nr:unnamed protein product [Adineta ricciae]CAF1072189.1 unnamed protein product [Adineta ricciae]